MTKENGNYQFNFFKSFPLQVILMFAGIVHSGSKGNKFQLKTLEKKSSTYKVKASDEIPSSAFLYKRDGKLFNYIS